MFSSIQGLVILEGKCYVQRLGGLNTMTIQKRHRRDIFSCCQFGVHRELKKSFQLFLSIFNEFSAILFSILF